MGWKNQLAVFKWNIKNFRWIYSIWGILYIVVLPVLGLLMRRGIPGEQLGLSYGYFSYIVRMLVYMLGALPFLMTLYSIMHTGAGDCIKTATCWREGVQYMLHFCLQGALVTVTMAFVGVIFRGSMVSDQVWQDYICLIVVLWFISALAHCLARLFGQVYGALIVIELYIVLCWLMRLGQERIWNLFSLEILEGLAFWMRAVSLVCVGIALEVFAVIKKSEKRRKSS